MEVEYIDFTNNSLFSKLHAWLKLFTKKQTWEFGVPYVKLLLKNKYKYNSVVVVKNLKTV